MKLLSKDFLGERLVPELENDTVQYFDHIRRYLFAQQYVCGQHVLDIACGVGYGSDILRRGGARQVISADISAAALHYATRQWGQAGFVQADAMYLPLPSETLDVVVTFETLEHLPDPRAFLIEIRRVLKSQGRLILSTPNRSMVSPGSETPYSPYHVFEPTRAELLALLEENGWRVLELYGMVYSERAASLVIPAHAPYQRPVSRIAWAAYTRLFVRAVLPSAVFRWLGRVRRIPQLDVADSVLVHDAPEHSSYFVALCSPG